VTVVVLAVHDVRSPREQTDIADSFDSFCSAVDDDHFIRRRFREIDLSDLPVSVVAVSKLDIGTELDTSRRASATTYCTHRQNRWLN
jgi:hypothetical protein